MTPEQRDANERGVVELDRKIAKAKKPWIAEAHRHTQAVMRHLLASNPKPEEPTTEELEAINEAHERRANGE